MIPIALPNRPHVLVTCPAPAFVYATWLRSYRRMFTGELGALPWFEAQRRIVTDLMPLVHCMVSPAAPQTIHAWVCGSPGVLHYAYVPRELRGNGIGRDLVKAVAGDAGVHTHLRATFKGFESYDPHALADALRANWRAAA